MENGDGGSVSFLRYETPNRIFRISRSTTIVTQRALKFQETLPRVTICDNIASFRESIIANGVRMCVRVYIRTITCHAMVDG